MMDLIITWIINDQCLLKLKLTYCGKLYKIVKNLGLTFLKIMHDFFWRCCILPKYLSINISQSWLNYSKILHLLIHSPPF